MSTNESQHQVVTPSTPLLQDPNSRKMSSQIEAQAEPLQKKEEPKETSKPLVPLAQAFCLIFFGMGFGLALEKSRVVVPTVILNQMLMKDFTMMKVFLAAGATSMLILAILSIFKSTKHLVEKTRKPGSRHGMFALLLGSGLLGSGMAFSGSCPGTVYAQVGSGMYNGFITISGAFIGSIIYGILDSFANFKTLLKKLSIPESKLTVDGLLSNHKLPYSLFAAIFIGVLVAAIAIFEHFFPYDPAVWGDQHNSNIVTRASWHPIICGVIIGSINLPMLLVTEKMIGSSSSYPAIIGILLQPFSKLSQKFPYFESSRKSSLWQVIYMIGVLLGALVSSYAAETYEWTNRSYLGLGPARSFIGGFLAVFGARFAGGCTSGHGITGFSKFFLDSAFAVPAMFAGGIATAFAFQGINNNHPF